MPWVSCSWERPKATEGSLAPAASYRDRLRLVSHRPACARGSGLALLDAVLLRRPLLGRRNDLDQLDRAAGGFHRRPRARRDAGDAEGELGRQAALAEQADAVLAAAGEAGGLQRRMVQNGLAVQLAGVDQLLDRADIHLGIILGEHIVEAALRQPHVERHLAALEAGDPDARARVGARRPAPGGLAGARADATPDAHARLAGALVVS